jgi:hypothetical protein
MNHGVVMFRAGVGPESRIWEMAMGRGQFISLYTGRRVEGAADGSVDEFWSSALVPTSREPPRLTPSPDHFEYVIEYGRYEPAYEGEFLEMCGRCSGAPWPTVVLPATAGNGEAIRLLGELHSIQGSAWEYLHERFYVVPRHNLRKPQKSWIRLSRLMGAIHPRDGWAYFLGFFRSGDGVVVFLSDNEADVGGLFEPVDAGQQIFRRADWLYIHGIIEKW